MAPLGSSVSQRLAVMGTRACAMNEVVRWPGTGKLHATILELGGGRRVLVLVAGYGLVVDQVSDVEEHFA